MGHVGGRRFSVGELHTASKTSSANMPHLNVWDFNISAAEFPQQKKRASLVWIGPKRVIVVSKRRECYLCILHNLFQSSTSVRSPDTHGILLTNSLSCKCPNLATIDILMACVVTCAYCVWALPALPTIDFEVDNKSQHINYSIH